jgi:hypothetical protein
LVVLEVTQRDDRRNPDRDVVVIEHRGKRLKSVIFHSHKTQRQRRAYSNVRIPVMGGVVQHAPAPLDGIGRLNLPKRQHCAQHHQYPDPHGD